MIIYRSRPLGLWVGAAAVILVYVTDWKVVLGKMPYVKGRFDRKD